MKRGLQASNKKSKSIFIKSFASGINTRQDSSILSSTCSSLSYNFCFDSGVLTSGYGVKNSKYIISSPLQDKIASVWMYSKRAPHFVNFLMVCTISGDVWYCDLASDKGFIILDIITFKSQPKAMTCRLNNEDVCIMSSPTDGMWIWNGVSYANHMSNSINTSSMTLHAKRMFITTPDNKDVIYFSEELNPTILTIDISAGGYIEMLDARGTLNTTISYFDYVYIFREYGISRLLAYDNQEDFRVSNLFVSSGRIIPSSVCLCGDTIMFLASDGIYAFDGTNTTRVLNNLTQSICANDDALGAYLFGKYYLCMKMDFLDNENIGCEQYEYINNAILVIDLINDSYSITRGIDIRHIVGINALNEILCVTRSGEVGQITKCGNFYDTQLQKLWRIDKTDLGDPSIIKVVRSLDILTKGDIILKCTSEKTSKTISVKGSEYISKIPINISCQLFGMDIISQDSSCYISRPKINFDY